MQGGGKVEDDHDRPARAVHIPRRVWRVWRCCIDSQEKYKGTRLVSCAWGVANLRCGWRGDVRSGSVLTARGRAPVGWRRTDLACVRVSRDMCCESNSAELGLLLGTYVCHTSCHLPAKLIPFTQEERTLRSAPERLGATFMC